VRRAAHLPLDRHLLETIQYLNRHITTMPKISQLMEYQPQKSVSKEPLRHHARHGTPENTHDEEGSDLGFCILPWTEEN
jgi:hypothetical protein